MKAFLRIAAVLVTAIVQASATEKDIGDYFGALPTHQFTESTPSSLVKLIRRGALRNSFIDAHNGFMFIERNGAQGSLEIALFLYPNRQTLLAVASGDYPEEQRERQGDSGHQSEFFILIRRICRTHNSSLVDPRFRSHANRQYAGKIKKTANGRWRSTSSEARRAPKIQPQRRIEKDGGVHVAKATQGICQDITQEIAGKENLKLVIFCQATIATLNPRAERGCYP